MNDRVQFNGRIPGRLRTAVKVSAAVADEMTQDQIMEDALLIYYGKETPEVLARQKKLLADLKDFKGGKSFPFEYPLTPNNCNAHHNGIVGVASSSLAGSTIQTSTPPPGYRRKTVCGTPNGGVSAIADGSGNGKKGQKRARRMGGIGDNQDGP